MRAGVGQDAREEVAPGGDLRLIEGLASPAPSSSFALAVSNKPQPDVSQRGQRGQIKIVIGAGAGVVGVGKVAFCISHCVPAMQIGFGLRKAVRPWLQETLVLGLVQRAVDLGEEHSERAARHLAGSLRPTRSIACTPLAPS